MFGGYMFYLVRNLKTKPHPINGTYTPVPDFPQQNSTKNIFKKVLLFLSGCV
jgi:hypothetical protein